MMSIKEQLALIIKKEQEAGYVPMGRKYHESQMLLKKREEERIKFNLTKKSW